MNLVCTLALEIQTYNIYIIRTQTHIHTKSPENVLQINRTHGGK